MKQTNFNNGFTRVPSLVSGFTLIELVVVMGIIGMLVTVVLIAVVPAISKGSDAAIKGDLSNIQSSAALDFFTLGRKFSTTGIAIISADCATLTTAGTIFANPKIQAALLDIKDQNGGIAINCNVAADGSTYAISATLKTAGQYWCVDNLGNQKGTYSTGTTGYVGQIGAGTTYAIQNGAYFCN